MEDNKKLQTKEQKKSQGRQLKRLLDVWDWNRSTSGSTPY